MKEYRQRDNGGGETSAKEGRVATKKKKGKEGKKKRKARRIRRKSGKGGEEAGVESVDGEGE